MRLSPDTERHFDDFAQSLPQPPFSVNLLRYLAHWELRGLSPTQAKELAYFGLARITRDFYGDLGDLQDTTLFKEAVKDADSRLSRAATLFNLQGRASMICQLLASPTINSVVIHRDQREVYATAAYLYRRQNTGNYDLRRRLRRAARQQAVPALIAQIVNINACDMPASIVGHKMVEGLAGFDTVEFNQSLYWLQRVELHKWLESNEGQGTLVNLSLSSSRVASGGADTPIGLDTPTKDLKRLNWDTHNPDNDHDVMVGCPVEDVEMLKWAVNFVATACDALVEKRMEDLSKSDDS